MKTILITGAIGFIGSHFSKSLLENNNIIGFDNMNDFYDIDLKEYRLAELEKHDNFTFIKGDLKDKELIDESVK